MVTHLVTEDLNRDSRAQDEIPLGDLLTLTQSHVHTGGRGRLAEGSGMEEGVMAGFQLTGFGITYEDW